MTVEKWQEKIWWLARYFELAVPMVFVVYLGFILALIGQRKVSPGIIVGALVGFMYMATLRDVVEATWRWQALDWLVVIGHRLAREEAAQLKTQVEKTELRLCRWWLLMLATMVTALAFARLGIWTLIARIVIGVVVATLALSHLLMVRVYIRKEIEL